MMKKKIFSKGLFEQSFRFGIVGILNTIVGYGIYFIMLTWFSYLLALLISTVIGIAHSFFWNKYWTFKSQGKAQHELVKFTLVYASIFFLNAILLRILVENYKINPKLAQVYVLIVTTLISYFGHKLWSFQIRENLQTQSAIPVNKSQTDE